MEHVLISCKNGVLYAGELLPGYSEERNWIGIKPSSHSEIKIYFFSAAADTIYFQNGTKFKTKYEENKVSGLKELLPEPRREMLIRSAGGVSFKGFLIGEGLGNSKEYCLALTEDCDMIVCIPESEAERIFIS